MFKTENLIGRSIYETPNLVCMDVTTKIDNIFLTQVLVSLPDCNPYFDETCIDNDIDTTYLSRKKIKEEILEGVMKYRNLRSQIPE